MRLLGKTLGVGLAVLLVISACGRGSGPDETPLSPGGPNAAVSADGIPIHYQVSGEGDYTLVFVHDWCADEGYWARQIPSFRVYYRVVTLDLAGHGRSGGERGRWTIEAFAGDVKAVVEHLDLDKVILVGHALGGPVVLEAARMLPRRVIGLVGVQTFSDIFMKPHESGQVAAMLDVFRPEFAEGLRRYALENYFRSSATEDFKKRIILDLTEASSEMALSALENFLRFDGAAVLKDLALPIRSINSDLPVLPFHIIRGNTEDFKLKFLKNTGHFPMQEDSREFNRLLSLWLGEIIQASYVR